MLVYFTVGLYFLELISGKQLFNHLTETCCNGTVAPLSANATDGCCNGVPFSLADFICCEGDILSLSAVDGNRSDATRPACCYHGNGSLSSIYDSESAVCCDGQITALRTLDFNASDGQCCAGKIVQRPNNDRRYACCGQELYELSAQVFCCNDTVFSAEGNRSCCGDRMINSQSELCCEQERVVQKENATSACCGSTAFDPSTAVCCNNRVQAKPANVVLDRNGICCGDDVIMDPESFMCCNDTVVERNNVTTLSCCGSHTFDSFTQICCGGEVHDMSAGTACCWAAAQMYDPEEAVCCTDDVLTRTEDDNQAQRHSCCGTAD